MKKIGNYKMTEYKISAGRYANIYTGVDLNKKMVAIKEIRQSEFSGYKISKENPVLQDLLTKEIPNVTKLLDIEESNSYFYFVLNMAKSTLDKEIKKREFDPHSDREAIYIITQVIRGLKFFYKKGIVYKHLSPRNIVKMNSNFELIIPSTIFPELKELNKADNQQDDYFYYSPEQLRGEKLNNKSDIWSLGCIFYALLFGKPPWSYNCPKKYLKHRNQAMIQKIKHFVLSDYIQSTGLIFPNTEINKWIKDVLTRMLCPNVYNRISLQELVEHNFLKYFAILCKQNITGNKFSTLRSEIPQNNYSCSEMIIKKFKQKQTEKIKSEIKNNLKNKQANKSSQISLDKRKTDVEELKNLKLDKECMNEFSDINKQVDEIPLNKFSIAQSLNIDMLKKQEKDVDTIIKELEEALNNDEGDEDENLENGVFDQKNLNMNQLKDLLVNLRHRIMLKVRAFEDIQSVVKSIYVITFKFFLLKATIYDLIKFEKKLLIDENPFNSTYWKEFKKKKVFAKIVNSIFKQQERIYMILDNYLEKTEFLLKQSKISFNKKFLSFINDDPYQKVTDILVLLFGNLIEKLKAMIKYEKIPTKKLRLMKFSVLIRLILLINEYGIFEVVPADLEFSSIWSDLENEKNPQKVKKQYEELVLKINQ